MAAIHSRFPPTRRRFPLASIGSCGSARSATAPIITTTPTPCFRGWYDFGGGSMADMGIYSLWPVFTALNSERADQCPSLGNPYLYHRGPRESQGEE